MGIAFFVLLSLVITLLFGLWAFMKGCSRGFRIGFRVGIADTCTAVNKALNKIAKEEVPPCPPTLN